MRHLYKSTFRLAIEELDDFRGARSDLDALYIKGRAHRCTSEEYRGHDEVDSKRLVSEQACPLEEIGERGGSKPGPGGAQHPEGTSLRYRRRQFRWCGRPHACLLDRYRAANEFCESRCDHRRLPCLSYCCSHGKPI